MKVKELTVGTARKLGLPGYSSLDVSAFVTVTLEEGEEVQEAYKRAWDTVEEQVIRRIEAKGLESPVAAEAQDKSNPQDWLDHESPDEQKAKIKSAKRLKEVEEGLKKDLPKVEGYNSKNERTGVKREEKYHFPIPSVTPSVKKEVN